MPELGKSWKVWSYLRKLKSLHVSVCVCVLVCMMEKRSPCAANFCSSLLFHGVRGSAPLPRINYAVATVRMSYADNTQFESDSSGLLANHRKRFTQRHRNSFEATSLALFPAIPGFTFFQSHREKNSSVDHWYMHKKIFLYHTVNHSTNYLFFNDSECNKLFITCNPKYFFQELFLLYTIVFVATSVFLLFCELFWIIGNLGEVSGNKNQKYETKSRRFFFGLTKVSISVLFLRDHIFYLCPARSCSNLN